MNVRYVFPETWIENWHSKGGMSNEFGKVGTDFYHQARLWLVRHTCNLCIHEFLSCLNFAFSFTHWVQSLSEFVFNIFLNFKISNVLIHKCTYFQYLIKTLQIFWGKKNGCELIKSLANLCAYSVRWSTTFCCNLHLSYHKNYQMT